MFAEAAYIKTVDQNVTVLPLGRHLNPNAAGLIVLSAAPNYSEITKPNLTTIGDNDPWAIAGIWSRVPRRLTGFRLASHRLSRRLDRGALRLT